MAYRRTQRVNERLAARRAAIIGAARDTAAENGLAAVQIASVAERARIAAGTMYRYFPGKADLLAAVLADIAETEVAAVRAAADRAPGPLSAVAAAVVTFAARAISQPALMAAVLVPAAELAPPAPRNGLRRGIAEEFASRISAAIEAGHIAAQDVPMAAAGLLGALVECTIGPLARPPGDAAADRASVLAAALFALQGLGIPDARARGLIIPIATGSDHEKLTGKSSNSIPKL